mmetsp:Transcript_7550/g.18339  ORF Transcript_7550/g.18339 Transcript_7550/m.18339 type:complete len:259 (-) Transcript_7550:201-977(-)
MGPIRPEDGPWFAVVGRRHHVRGGMEAEQAPRHREGEVSGREQLPWTVPRREEARPGPVPYAKRLLLPWGVEKRHQARAGAGDTGEARRRAVEGPRGVRRRSNGAHRSLPPPQGQKLAGPRGRGHPRCRPHCRQGVPGGQHPIRAGQRGKGTDVCGRAVRPRAHGIRHHVVRRRKEVRRRVARRLYGRIRDGNVPGRQHLHGRVSQGHAAWEREVQQRQDGQDLHGGLVQGSAARQGMGARARVDGVWAHHTRVPRRV